MNELPPSSTDRELLDRLAAGEVAAFEQIFQTHYKALCRFSLRYVRIEPVAEELVCDVLTALWQKRQTLLISSLQAYLFTAVRNASLNYLKSQFARQQFASDAVEVVHPETAEDVLSQQELEAIIEAGVEALPTACRTIFQLSRNAEMSYAEIAQELGISPKTVKAQMGIALKKLRVYVGKYWGKLLLLGFSLFS
jgi:RNA polymerase sigma-70 factor, ECF subfamily